MSAAQRKRDAANSLTCHACRKTGLGSELRGTCISAAGCPLHPTVEQLRRDGADWKARALGDERDWLEQVRALTAERDALRAQRDQAERGLVKAIDALTAAEARVETLSEALHEILNLDDGHWGRGASEMARIAFRALNAEDNLEDAPAAEGTVS